MDDFAKKDGQKEGNLSKAKKDVYSQKLLELFENWKQNGNKFSNPWISKAIWNNIRKKVKEEGIKKVANSRYLCFLNIPDRDPKKMEKAFKKSLKKKEKFVCIADVFLSKNNDGSGGKGFFCFNRDIFHHIGGTIEYLKIKLLEEKGELNREEIEKNCIVNWLLWQLRGDLNYQKDAHSWLYVLACPEDCFIKSSEDFINFKKMIEELEK
jgi:hypothetical protein